MSICDVPNVLKVIKIIKLVINLIRIFVPIILIIFGMIDFARAITKNDELNKSLKAFVKKAIAAIIIFLIPTLVNIIFRATMGEVNYKKCFDNADDTTIKELYMTQMDKLIERAKKNKDMISYSEAEAYLVNIDNEELRSKYRKELNEIKKEIDKKSENKEESSSNPSTPTTPTTPSNTNYKTYSISDDDVYYLAMVGICEQSTPEGVAAEVSLMANRYELFGSSYSSVANYVRKSGWFACYDDEENPTSAHLNAVRDVLINGNRRLPLYIDEHDCRGCTTDKCKNGVTGDICKLVTNGKTIEDYSEIKKNSNYVSNSTKITNIYGSHYTFYSFPCNGCDPFGYTDDAYNKVMKK